jgi:hypothetical protein
VEFGSWAENKHPYMNKNVMYDLWEMKIHLVLRKQLNKDLNQPAGRLGHLTLRKWIDKGKNNHVRIKYPQQRINWPCDNQILPTKDKLDPTNHNMRGHFKTKTKQIKFTSVTKKMIYKREKN